MSNTLIEKFASKAGIVLSAGDMEMFVKQIVNECVNVACDVDEEDFNELMEDGYDEADLVGAAIQKHFGF